MERKVRSEKELLSKKEEILNAYRKTSRKSSKPVILTKAERKILGVGKDEGKAILKYVRISSRKVKIVLDLIKGKDLNEAYGILRYTPKSASEVLMKLLKSAEANAANNNSLNRDALYVADAFSSQGPTLKRVMPRARGSANRIKKRTSHITVVVRERGA